MILNKFINKLCLPLLLSGFAAFGCSQTSSNPSNNTSAPSSAPSCSNATVGASPTLLTTSSTNTIPVYVGDKATTGSVGYTNEPLVSVTICTPNHTSPDQCQTISNILLDTGSYGLRVFGSAINSSVSLAQQTVSINSHTYNLAQCAVFGSGADWGAVKNADVTLGNQTASNIPIQVIDSHFETMPSGCSDLQPDTDPCTAGFNGILGVGPFSYDCGADCASTNDNVNPGDYFACTGTSCGDVYSGACSGGTCAVAVPLNQQIINPVAKFAANFNNGISLTLPAIGAGGASAISGSMTIGIGSSASNVPISAAVVYGADSTGMSDGMGMDLQTTYAGTTYGQSGSSAQSFLDSGSNALYFPNTNSLNVCADTGFYCPVSTTSQSATIDGFTSTPSYVANFSVANAASLFESPYSAFNDIAAPQDSGFDWGLPFFFGRTVYVGIDGQSATYHNGAATGPYWAF